MKLLICGSRHLSKVDINTIDRDLSELGLKYTTDKIISGGAGGPDSVAIKYAIENNIPYIVFYADWTKHGRAAGIIRNRTMVKEADVCLAYWDGKSKGTKNTIEEMRKKNKVVYVIRYE